ncbi:hypothetical protein AYO20_05667 [Fonsecaea nubica]|uniref:Uncharacterized protein n=1 Tax=Fonsecaea nubica TaxID=856822 RepID=A0A178D0D8_9EURO|nr:hypothetical protein AYO20_05667 [Fonsecaea nubica]OAL34952.1 hypothetical protein AYO20_05667 [Fonsecaea nubica]
MEAAEQTSALNREKAPPERVRVPAVGSRVSNHSLYKVALPFIIGGLSGSIATICLQPVDMVKVRLQLTGEGSRSGPRASPFTVARDIVKQGRPLELYSGLSAALLRQVVYGTSRLGLFFTFEDALKTRAKERGRQMTFIERAGAGIAAGALGSFIGNPTEVALIRMQSDGMRPMDQRQNYRSVFDTLHRIVKNEGVLALWTGARATVVRAMCTNFGQLAFFSETKNQLEKFSSIPEQARVVTASTVAGFFASFFSMPLDFVKTRLQRQSTNLQGRPTYAGVSDCFRQVLQQEGPLRFYRGFGTYFARMAPHSYVTPVLGFDLLSC